MTVAADKTKEIYTGNDLTTVFPYPFKIFQSTDLLVILTDTSVTPNTETTLTAGVDYTVSGVGDESGGNVTYPVSGDPLTTTEKLTVWRVPAILQGTDFQNQGGFFAQTHEDALDLLTMVCQYVSEFVQRAFALSVSDESGASLTIPGPEAGSVLGWNSLANALINLDPGSVTLATPASDSIIAAMINAAGTQATLTKLLSGNTAIWQKGADVASAAVLPVISDGNYVDVIGVAAITSMATVGKGTVMMLQFDGILVFTHHATDLVLPNGGNNITTATGDHAIMEEYDTGKWRCVSYIRASSLPALLSVANTFSGDNTFSGLSTLSKVLDSGLFIVDGGDNTKKISFQASGITPGNTRIFNMPDKDLTFDYGTYTPTISATSNLDSTPSGNLSQYMRTGNVVTVSGNIDLDPTVAGTQIRFEMSLPIAPGFANYLEAGGTGAFKETTTIVPVYIESASNNNVKFYLFPGGTASARCVYHFTYLI
jgi:hypothetical protein